MPMPKSHAASPNCYESAVLNGRVQLKNWVIPTRPLFWLDGRARNLSIQSSNSGTQALRDDLRVMPQCSFGVRMPEVALHILDSGVILHMGR
jgi:hypothetical protein